MSKKTSNTGLINTAESMFKALKWAERFISGFEGDTDQQPSVDPHLHKIRKALKDWELAGTPGASKDEQIVIYVEGGLVQSVYTNLAQVKVVVADKDCADIGEDPITNIDPEPLDLAPEDIARHL